VLSTTRSLARTSHSGCRAPRCGAQGPRRGGRHAACDRWTPWPGERAEAPRIPLRQDQPPMVAAATLASRASAIPRAGKGQADAPNMAARCDPGRKA